MPKFDKRPSIIADAFRLDIFDLNYIYSSRIFDRFLEPPGRVLPKKGLLLRIAVFFKHMAEELNISKWKKEKQIKHNAFLFFCETQNQRESLKPVADCLKNSCLFGKTGEYSLNQTHFLSYIYSLPFFFHILFHYFRSKGKQKLAFSYNFDRYWFTYGFYIGARKWLRKITPLVLVMANDHVVNNRVLCKAARDENIPTVYFQHASVTDEFPPLEFDFAFLEGLDALNTYARIGPSETRVFLIGSPKFDPYKNLINQKSKVESLGICCNLLDSPENVEKLTQKIHEAFPDLRMSLRSHPADKNMAAWRNTSQKFGLLFSDPRIETSFKFLSNTDCIIAGNSNIHLEATLLNIPSLYFDFSDSQNQGSYSFVSKKLCEYFVNAEDLLEKIKLLTISKDHVRKQAKYYVDTIETKYDGTSSQLASSLIMNIFQEKKTVFSEWARIDMINIEAYSLIPEIQDEK